MILTAGTRLILLFKHLAMFVTYLVSKHVINPSENVTNKQQMYSGIEIN